MLNDFSVPPVPPHYDPVAVFASVFADPELANDVGDALTCDEVNVLVGLLASHGHQASADRWLAAHRRTCEHLIRH